MIATASAPVSSSSAFPLSAPSESEMLCTAKSDVGISSFLSVCGAAGEPQNDTAFDRPEIQDPAARPAAPAKSPTRRPCLKPEPRHTQEPVPHCHHGHPCR